MHICFVVEGYPFKNDSSMPFVRELIHQLALNGIDCSVIAPQSITKMLKKHVPYRPTKWVDEIDKSHRIIVYQPRYISFSNHFLGVEDALRVCAIRRAGRNLNKKKGIDALYCHFWHMGALACMAVPDIPIYVACGESRISIMDRFDASVIRNLLERLLGVIYVGTKSYVEAKELGLQTNQPYIIAPNGYNASEFYKCDRRKCRRKLGFDESMFIVSFVGGFNKRKGADRLCAALKILNQEDAVHSIFIGKGTVTLDCENIAFCGSVKHEEIVEYLNASDVFVLPTNAEGCCNAIIEALACGLPVISSNQIFNADILDDSCSITIDPMNIDGLVSAIRCIKKNEVLRTQLAEGALQKSKQLRIEDRARRIKAFLVGNYAKRYN